MGYESRRWAADESGGISILTLSDVLCAPTSVCRVRSVIVKNVKRFSKYILNKVLIIYYTRYFIVMIILTLNWM